MTRPRHSCDQSPITGLWFAVYEGVNHTFMNYFHSKQEGEAAIEKWRDHDLAEVEAA